jgi:hypothetical protein
VPKRAAAPETPDQSIRRHIARILAQKSRGPRFVAELTSTVQAAAQTSPREIEAVLQALSDEGAVIVRKQSHADPHLQTADLRIVAPVDTSAEDGLTAANASIDALWRHWLSQWTAKHQCDAAR